MSDPPLVTWVCSGCGYTVQMSGAMRLALARCLRCGNSPDDAPAPGNVVSIELARARRLREGYR